MLHKSVSQLLASLALVALLAPTAMAQNVTTYVSGLHAPSDMVWDAAGNMFVAANDASGNSQIMKIDPTGSTVSVFSAGGFVDVWGLAMSPSGVLYASDRALFGAGAGKIWKVLADGSKTVFASGFTDPIFMDFDATGDLYVSEWSARNLKRVSPTGVVSMYAPALGAVGEECGDLEIMPNGDLYIGVGPNLKLVRAGGGPVSTVVGGLGGIVGLRRNGDNSFFVSRGVAHDLWTISPGPVRTIAKWNGPGIGCIDGPRASANFSQPVGIRVFRDRLYVADRNCGSIRTIDLAGSPVSGQRHSWGDVKSYYR